MDKERKKMMIIGLTGGISSGKSTVAEMIKQLGIPIVDADVIAREVVEPNEEAYAQIVQHFGTSILNADQTIDRKKLGAIVFNDENERKKLNSIVHPAIRQRMKQQKEQYLQEGFVHVVLDIPLLFESKLTYLVEKTLLVYVNEDVQLQRLMARDESTKEEALSRIKSQMPLNEKIKLADAVINNNGTVEETKEQLFQVLKKWSVIQ